MAWSEGGNSLGYGFATTGSPYKAAQGAAADAQRRAMHLSARGFHGLGALSRVVKRVFTARTSVAIPPKGATTRKRSRFFTPPQGISRRQMGVPRVNVRGGGKTGLSDDPIYGDTMAGSFDGLGATYGARTHLKVKKGVRLTPGEKVWLAKDAAIRSRLTAGKKMKAVGTATGARFFTPMVGMGDFDMETGMGKSWLQKAVKKVASTAKAVVKAPAKLITAPIKTVVTAVAGKKAGIKVGTKVSGILKVARGAVGIKKGLSASQLKKAAVAQKVGLVVGGTAAVILTGGVAAAAIAAKAAAAKAAGGGVVALAAKAAAAKATIGKVRKALGLPAISLDTLKGGKTVEQAIEEQVAAGISEEDAVKNVVAQATQDATEDAPDSSQPESESELKAALEEMKANLKAIQDLTKPPVVTSPIIHPVAPVSPPQGSAGAYGGETALPPPSGYEPEPGPSDTEQAESRGMFGNMGAAVPIGIAAVIGLLLLRGRK